MSNCPFCSEEIADDDAQCPSCGMELPRPSPANVGDAPPVQPSKSNAKKWILIGGAGCGLCLLVLACLAAFLLPMVSRARDAVRKQAAQAAAQAALSGPQDFLSDWMDAYTRRRDRVVKAVQAMGMSAAVPRASLYIWARVPDGYTSAEMAQLLLEELDVVVTPGSSYGKYGEGYIRLSLTTPDEQVEKGCQRMETWKIPPPKAE